MNDAQDGNAAGSTGGYKVEFKLKTFIARFFFTAFLVVFALGLLYITSDSEITISRQYVSGVEQVEGSVIRIAYGRLSLCRIEFKDPIKVYVKEEERRLYYKKNWSAYTQLRAVLKSGDDIELIPFRNMDVNEDHVNKINRFLEKDDAGNFNLVVDFGDDRHASVFAALMLGLGFFIGVLSFVSDFFVWGLQKNRAKQVSRSKKI